MSDIFTIHDFENEQQWLKGRMNGIGGSDASVTIGRNPYKSNVELYEEKIGKAVPEDISDKPCVIYGNKAEEPIRELFQADHPEYKVDYHEFRILQSKKYPFMQASLDGELTDQDGRKGILEIKTSSINQSMQYTKWKDQIPDNYYAQVLHYLLVTGWDFVVLRARLRCDWWDDVARERDYRIDRCNVEADLEYLLEAEMRFWKCVENRKMPGCILPEI